MEQVSSKWIDWVTENRVSDEWLAKRVDWLAHCDTYAQYEYETYLALAELLILRGWFKPKGIAEGD